MSFAERYLDKHRYRDPEINNNPSDELKGIVVVPCYDEDKIERLLDSLSETDRVPGVTEVILVINSGENDREQVIQNNKKTYQKALDWIERYTDPALVFYPVLVTGLPAKHAGAGFARKIGMDEAIARFNQTGNPDGIIFSLDADCTVSKNYFHAIYTAFSASQINFVTVNFEHPLEGAEFPQSVYDSIINYELHLRYFRNALKYSGFPYPIYTIGSAFAVKAETYVKQGGMNRRKAGEDFYFLHKLTRLGKYGELTKATVYPSPRISERVPFGTGPAIKEMVQNGNTMYTYLLEAFIAIKEIIKHLDNLYRSDNIKKEYLKLPVEFRLFTPYEEFYPVLEEINQNVSTIHNFRKRFFQWLDAFKIVKFLNDSHRNIYLKKPVDKEAGRLLALMTGIKPAGNSKSLLMAYREMDKV